MLGLVENVLAHHDKELLQHLIKHGVTSQVPEYTYEFMYVWCLSLRKVRT